VGDVEVPLHQGEVQRRVLVHVGEGHVRLGDGGGMFWLSPMIDIFVGWLVSAWYGDGGGGGGFLFLCWVGGFVWGGWSVPGTVVVVVFFGCFQ